MAPRAPDVRPRITPGASPSKGKSDNVMTQDVPPVSKLRTFLLCYDKGQTEGLTQGLAAIMIPSEAKEAWRVRLSTALSVEHWAVFGDAFAVVEVASGLFQEPVTDAAVDLRQGQATAVGPWGGNPHGVARAGSPLACAPTPG